MTSLKFKHVYGPDIANHLKDLSRIRITVFREWPYIYEGSEEYEREYLSSYVQNERSLCLLILDGEKVVGVSTLMPLADEHEDLRKPLTDAGFEVSKIFYYSESCLLADYRGSGLYPEIFRLREEHVRSFGSDYNKICFCSVVRPNDHPLKPKDYRPLYPAWRRLGFERAEKLQMSFLWTDVGEQEETRKYLDVWMKDL